MPSLTQLKKPLFAAALVFVAGSADANASIMRCGKTGLIHLGDSRYKVKSECDSPVDARQRIEYRTVRVRVPVACADKKETGCGHWLERTVEVLVDEWTYDFGQKRFIQFLTFENGSLVHITHGGYSRN